MSVSVELPTRLAKRLVHSASQKNHTLASEVQHRLEESLRLTELPLSLPLDLERRVERTEAAARAFAGAMQIADRMSLGKKRGLRFALEHTRRMTGVDLGKEVGALPEETTRPLGSPAVEEFLDAWESGALGLPWSPALSVDVYAFYQTWATAEGQCPAYIAQFVPALIKCGRVSTARKRWRHGGRLNGPSMMLVPKVHAKRPGSLTDWLGDCISAFQTAAKDAGNAP